MNAPDDVPEFNDLSINDRIDLICDQFEKAWLTGMQPRIEDFLSARFSADERPRLLRELLIAELDLKRKAGEVLPARDDYRQRFPDVASVVEEVFRAVAKPEPEPAELFAATMLTGTGSADAERHSKVGDYELLYEIARGGMGVVYKARHTKLGRLAAVKLIRSGDLAGEEEIRRFYAEAEAASQLDHPGIVPLFEAGQENGQHYLAMAFVDGPSLWQKVKEQPLEPREAARVMQQVAEAVQHAHERGIIHRDLKPQNILMTSTGQPRVTDFGLAKQMATDSSLTATGQVMGTPSYMPPEQASGSVKELDHRADVYSLGATLYCLLTGRPPFQAATLPETLRQVCEVEPVAPRLVNPSIPLDLETICLKALRKEPDRRYDTAQEFADDLGRFLMGESILARPVGQSERFMRWCRRKPLVAAVVVLSALLVAALVVGMPVVTSAMLEAKKQKTFAEGETNRAKENEQLANAEKTTAVRQSRIAEVRRLTAESRSIREALPIRSTLLALEAIQGCPAEEKELLVTPENELRECVKGIGGFPLTTGGLTTGSQTPMVISSDGRWLATEDHEGTRIWDLKCSDVNANSRLLIGRAHGSANHIAFSSDGRWLATDGDTVRLWDLTLPDPTLTPRVLSGHKGGVSSLAFSLDGHWLATGGDDLTSRLWDLSASDPSDSPRVLSGHESRVDQLAFSPDGHWLITNGFMGTINNSTSEKVSVQNSNGTARLWDLRSSDPSAKSQILASVQSSAVAATAISPDGHWLATGYADGPACLWDLTAPNPVATPRVLSGHQFGTQLFAFSLDGHWLATASSDAVRLWELMSSSPSANPKVLTGHEGSVNSLAFSPDGRWFVTGSDDRTARLWDLLASSETSMPAHVLRGHKDLISQLAISPDSHWLVTCGQEKTARLWDLAAPDPSTTARVLPDQEDWIRTIMFSPDGHWLVTRAFTGVARIWDLESPVIGPHPHVLNGHWTSDRSTITPNSHWLATRFGNSAWLWDLTSPNPSVNPRVLRGHDGNIRSIVLNQDGHWLATSSDDKTVRLWNLMAPDASSNPRVLRGLADLIDDDCLAISDDGHWLAAGSRNGTVWLWNLESTQANDHPYQLRGNTMIQWLGFAAGGHWLITASHAGTIRLWDLDLPEPGIKPFLLSGNEVKDTPSAYQPVSSVISLDGKWLASQGKNARGVRLWDLTSPQLKTNSREMEIHTGSMAISPNGRWLVSSSGGNRVELSDLMSPNPGANQLVLRGHESAVQCWAFTPDGHWLATGDQDTVAIVWDLTLSNPSSHPRLLRGKEGGGAVATIAISPDGNWGVTVNRFGVQIWDLQLDRLVALAKTTAGRSLSSSERAQYQLPQNPASDLPLARAGIRDILPTWPTDEHFHERQASESEKGGSLFAAVFHLKRLAAFRPDDQDIKKRLVHAEMRRANGLPTITYESLTDGSFETGSTGVTPVFSGWKVSTWLQRPESAFITQTQFKVGQKALEIVAKDGDDVQCQQAVKVKPNTRYRFRGWVKTRDVAVTQEGGKTGACLSVVELGISDSLVGTSDWKQLQIEFDSGNRPQIQLGPRLGCAGSVCIGTAWFDDLQLEELTNDDGNNSSGASDGK